MTSCCPYDAERDLCIYRDELQLVIISVTGSAAGDGWVNTEELRIIQVPDRLNGVRILLRPLQPGDGAAVWPAVEESRADIARWEDWHERHQCPEDSEHDGRDDGGREYARKIRHQFLAVGRALAHLEQGARGVAQRHEQLCLGQGAGQGFLDESGDSS